MSLSFKYAQGDEARNNGDWYLEKEPRSRKKTKAVALQHELGLHIPSRERHEDSASSSHKVE